MNKKCVECESQGKYRCRCCAARYCSAACWKAHVAAFPNHQDEPRDNSSTSCGERTVPTMHSDSLEVLQPSHLDALSNDAHIYDCLKSVELQTVLRTIDSSRSRLDALEAAQHNIPEFRAFCEHVLRVIYSVHQS